MILENPLGWHDTEVDGVTKRHQTHPQISCILPTSIIFSNGGEFFCKLPLIFRLTSLLLFQSRCAGAFRSFSRQTATPR